MEAKTPVLGGDASEEEEGDEDEDNDDDDEEGNRAAVNEAEAPDSVSRREAGAGRRRRWTRDGATRSEVDEATEVAEEEEAEEEEKEAEAAAEDFKGASFWGGGLKLNWFLK